MDLEKMKTEAKGPEEEGRVQDFGNYLQMRASTILPQPAPPSSPPKAGRLKTLVTDPPFKRRSSRLYGKGVRDSDWGFPTLRKTTKLD